MNGVRPSRGLQRKFERKYGRKEGVWDRNYLTISIDDPVDITVDKIAETARSGGAMMSQVDLRSDKKVDPVAFRAYVQAVTARMKVRGIQ